MSESYTTESALQAIAEAHPGKDVFLSAHLNRFKDGRKNETFIVTVDGVFPCSVVYSLSDAVLYAKDPARYGSKKQEEINRLEAELAKLKAA